MTKEINCVFTMSGTYHMKERSVLAAYRAAMKNFLLPEDRDYLDDSLSLDSLDECMEANGWDYDEIELLLGRVIQQPALRRLFCRQRLYALR